MGIGNQALNLTFSLWLDGRFNGFKSVIELGSQDICSDPLQVDFVLSRLSQKKGVRTRNPDAEAHEYPPKILYETLGFEDYQCIDADGRNGALVYDLNENLRSKGFDKQFDLVTNHGTTEHCFDQLNAFRNIHELCRPGGIMLHGLPFQGYLNHGYFNYQPKFYLDLAQANGYELLGIYLNPDTMSPDICAYSAALLTHMSVTPTKFLLLFVALRKTSGAEFQMPAVSQSDAASQQRIDQIRQQIPRIFLPAVLPPVLPPEPGDIFSGRTLAKVLLKRIGGTIRSYF